MEIFILSALFVSSVIFFLLESSFKFFSKISITGFLEDLNNQRYNRFNFIKHHQQVLNSLFAFSTTLQTALFLYAFFFFENVIIDPFLRFFLLLLFLLILFQVFLASWIYLKKESLLKKVLFLYIIPWFFYRPFNFLFSFFTRRLEPNNKKDQDNLSEKEMKIFIEEGIKEGVIEKEDKEAIESILEFGDTLVKEIMTPRVDMIYARNDISLNDLIELINTHKKSRYPVIDGKIDNIEGIILSKDIFDNWQANSFKMSTILRKPYFVPETMRILELLKEMQRTKQKFAIVVDEFGGVSGIVTMEDIVEEIVGEIQDEYDEDINHIVKEKDYFMVKGDTDISDINDTLKINLDTDEDYQTVAGLISFQLGKIPRESDLVSVNDYIFEVIKTSQNRIDLVRIYKNPEANDRALEPTQDE